ncbi:MAG: cardiolipin synthase [Pseudomonadota bacterium]|nr:cardiolipin synthase [Pseudomonadota bacterium]
MEWTWIIDWVVRLLLVAAIVYRNRSSTPVRLTWVVVVLAIPFLGAVLYLLFGEIWRRQGRLAEHQRVIEAVRDEMTQSQTALPSAVLSDAEAVQALHYSRFFERQGAFPLRPGNHWRLYENSAEVVSALVDDIESASRSCHLLFYIWLDDRAGTAVARALMAAAARGVRCRVLVDALGSREFLMSRLCSQMRLADVEVVAAFSIGKASLRLDHRNHRKIVVIDGEIGWTGSQNMADAEFRPKRAYGPWVDVMARLTGPVVQDLQSVFAEDWVLETREAISALVTPMPSIEKGGCPMQLYASGPTQDFKVIRQMMIAGIFSAERELIITTPYFVPDESTVTAYCALSRAGVRAVLIVPKRNDSRLVAAASRSFYRDLLEAGVEIYEYREGLLHSKTMTMDGRWGSLETANFDRRSFELNYENGLTIADMAFAQRLRQTQQGYIDRSDRVILSQWIRRPAWRRLQENAARILAPIL